MNTQKYIINITSGRGPAECCWVVAKVLSRLVRDLEKNRISYKVTSQEKGIEKGTLQSAAIQIRGKELQQFINTWQGTILWIGQSPFRKFHKRKNWFIGINSNIVSKSMNISESDIYYQTLRSSGPGGQHVNKVSTAVRAIHKPTGLTVTASDTRSQMQNKKLATQRLFELFKQKDSEQIIKEQLSLWSDHNNLNRGNPIRTYKRKEFKEVNLIEKQLE